MIGGENSRRNVLYIIIVITRRAGWAASPHTCLCRHPAARPQHAQSRVVPKTKPVRRGTFNFDLKIGTSGHAGLKPPKRRRI